MSDKTFFFSQNGEAPDFLTQMDAWLELMPCAACLIDQTGLILLANKQTAAVSGFPAEMLKGSHIAKYGLTPADVQNLLNGKGDASLLKEMVTKNMEALCMNVRASAVPGTSYIILCFDAAAQYHQAVKDKKFFESLVHSYPCAVTVQDGQGKCLVWNEKAEKMFSLSSAQALGRPLYDILPSALCSALELLDRDVKEKKQTRAVRQMSFKNNRGNELTLSVVKVPLLDPAGEVRDILTIYENITVRHAQEEDLIQTRNLLQAILDHVPLGIYTRTADGVMTFFNKQSQEVLSETEPKCVNTPHPKQDAAVVRMYAERERKILEEGKLRDFPNEVYVDRDGREKMIHIIKVPLRHAGPEPLVLSIVEDVTKKLEQEREIVTANNFLSSIVNNVPIGLYVRMRNGKLLLRNKMCEQIFGANENVFDEQGSLPHETKEQVQGYLSRETQVLQSGKLLDIPEEPYTTGTGEQRLLHLVKVPVSDSEGNPEFVITMVEDITRKKEQERKLMEGQSFQQAILDNAPMAIYARGVDMSMFFVNKRALELFPYEKIDEEENDDYREREEEVFRSGKILDIPEEEYLRRDGKKVLLHLIKVPVYDDDGRPFMMLSLAEDITQKKQQERKLAEVQNIHQLVLSHTPMAIYAYDAGHRLCFYNKAADVMFPGEMSSDQDQYGYNSREDEIFKGGKILDIPEEEYVRRDGKKVLLHLVKVPVFAPDGQPLMVLTIAEDITQQKQQEKEVRDTRNFLQNVVDNLPVALSVKRRSGEYVVWNKRSEDVFGVPAKDVIGKDNYRTDITREQAEFMQEADERIFQSRKELNIAQELISTPSEGVKIMHTVKTPLYKPDGTPDYLLSVSEDITAKTKMEKQIRETGEKNSLLVENAREGIIILEDYQVIYANVAACKLLGYESAEEIVRKPFLNFISPDHQPFATDKYESVVNGVEGGEDPIQLHFVKKSGSQAEVEMAAMASKYLGRRIVIVFLRDVTAFNKSMREVRGEREKFKNVFEKGLLPAFILNHKGYINVMNRAARDLFHFTEEDRHFYRNVYIRPALTLQTRRHLSRGESAQMDYVFDFDKAAAKFPGRIHGEGKMLLHVSLEPFNRRDAKDGTVEADYLVTLDRRERGGTPPPSVPLAGIAKKVRKPQPPCAVLLPNTQPYAVCSSQFKIISCNDLFCALSQHEREELTGQELVRLFAAESASLFKEDLEKLKSTGELENREYRLCLASGLETTPVRLCALRNRDGNYVFIFHNLALQKQLMNLLQERSAQLNALLDATDGAVFSVQYEDGKLGRVERANKFFSRFIGYSREELTSVPFERLFTAPDGKNSAEVKEKFGRAVQNLQASGRANLAALLFTKDGKPIETAVTLTELDIPGQNVVLAVVTDLSDLLERLSRNSRAALELSSVRQSLPGIYLKTNLDGRVLEVSANLPYLSQAQAQDMFLDKLPKEYWPEEVASKELFAVKESAGVHINTTFDFEWEFAGRKRFLEAVCMPIIGREEVVIWLRDATERRLHEEHIQELYSISNENNSTITQQVDRILDFGKKIFKSDVGIVLRFRDSNPDELTVIYSTPSPFNIERYMVFPLEECLFDVRDDNVVVFPDLSNTNCKRCLHKEKNFGSLIAAPLYVGGKVAGVLCFAARASKTHFEEGAEELIGIMSRILSLRIELREASKTLGETSQSFIRTLEYLNSPAVVLDLYHRVRYANDVFLGFTGRQPRNVENREFFDEFVRNPHSSRHMFDSYARGAVGNAFQVRLEQVDDSGKYSPVQWDVFLMKDIKGEVEGYGLIGVPQK